MVEPPVSSAARGAFILHPSSGSSMAAKRIPFIPIRTGSALPASGLTLVRYFTGIVFAYLPNTFFRNSNVVDFPLSPKGPAAQLTHSASVSSYMFASGLEPDHT